jgi:murein DD-endopeptidase MepM/ murein hydrolase activator NlpD
MTKIALFTKPYMRKACFTLALLVFLASQPSVAHAGFFSDLVTKVMGSSAQATGVDSAENKTTNNSQTIPLLEPSTNPDTNNSSSAKAIPATIIDSTGGALAPVASPLGPATDIEQYASSAKISSYVVKKGDTLGSIAKKFKTTEASITYSNADLKKSDLLKVGQKLVILPLNLQADKALAKQPVVPTSKPDLPADVQPKPQPVAIDTEGQMFTLNIDTPSPADQVKQVAPVVNTTDTNTQPADSTTPTGQPVGSISGGYIWPFDKGVGRVSQGLHADQAYDFAAPTGTPIHAISGGTVLIAHPTGYNGGYGRYVVINFDDGRQAIFGHMSKVAVEEGDVVSQGDIIGYVGSTGHSTGPHVHIGFHGPLGNPYIGLKLNSTDFQTND